jgi:hypothetical protein
MFAALEYSVLGVGMSHFVLCYNHLLLQDLDRVETVCSLLFTQYDLSKRLKTFVLLNSLSETYPFPQNLQKLEMFQRNNTQLLRLQ